MKKKLLLSLIAVCSVMFGLMAQNKTVTGTVTGADGAPIAGATVVVEGTSIGTTTDAAGHFTLAAPSDGKLNVSFIGYKDEVVAIAGKTAIDVSLEESHTAIDDVVVLAFGQTTKEAFTGSAAVVKSDDIVKVQTSNISDVLVGKVAGVQTASSSGNLSSSVSIRVRGFGSINAGQAPLWVVDGMPYEGDLNNLNTNDIESMTVLKDAASNALYGARGANGVIMVTTKRAKSGDAKVSVDAKWGVTSKALESYDTFGSPASYYEQYYKGLYNYAQIVGGYDHESANTYANNNLKGHLGYMVYSVPSGQGLIGLDGRLNPNATLGNKMSYRGQDFMLYPDNWDNEAYKKGFRQEYNANISAATEKSNFYASLGYLSNEGIIRSSSMERYTARLKADYQAKKWLKVGANMGYSHFRWSNGNSNEGAENSTYNIFAFSSQMAPIYPVYMRDGEGNIMIDQYGMQMYDYGEGDNGGNKRAFLASANPLQTSWLDKNVSEGNAFSVSGFVDINIYDGLKLTLNGSTNIDETRTTDLNNPYYGQFAEQGGSVYKYHSRDWAYNLQQLLTYDKTFAHDHTINLLLGHENYRTRYHNLYAGRNKFFAYGSNDELAGAIVDNGGSSNSYITDYNTEGYFFRAQYDWKDKLYISGSYRRDASSNFHPDHRWGNFWSLGAAWIINKEPWFNANWVDMLKVKASYGSQGNDAIGSYRYVDTYEIVNDGADNVSTIFNTKGNPDITWETNTNFNAGVEFSFWNGRLSGSVEYFNRKTSDMLFFFTVPTALGYSGYYDNIGDLVNQGVELELNADLIRKKNIVWDFSLNLTHLNNKVTKLGDEFKTNWEDGHQGYISGLHFIGEGLPLYSFRMREYAGVNQQTGESMWYKHEKDEQNRVIGSTPTTVNSQATYRNTGRSAIPDVYGGFSTSISVYGFDASIAFTYQIGGWVYDYGYAQFMGSPYSGGNRGSNYHKDLANAWTPENTNTDIPRFMYSDQYTNLQSDRFLTSASYLNISNINVGYTLPRSLTSKIGIDKLRIYMACDNVVYWSHRQGLDPRYSFTGSTNYANYSPIRTISGGLNVVF